MHTKLGHTNIQCRHAQIPRRQRPDGTATAHITANHERLVRQTQLVTDMTVYRCWTTVGGVTLVVVNLDHRPLIENRAVILVMLIHVIRMDTVGIIRRDHHRTGDGASLASAGPSVQYRRQERPLGALGRHTANLFVIVAD